MTYDPSAQQPNDPYSSQPNNDPYGSQPTSGGYPQQPTSGGYYQQPGYEQQHQQPGYQQPGYQQPGYQQPGYQQPGYQQPKSGYSMPGELPQSMAVTSLVLGIVSVPLLFCCYLGTIPAILAIIFGGIGLSQVNKGEARGKNLAMTGLILGAATIVLTILLIILGLVLNFSGAYNPTDMDY